MIYFKKEFLEKSPRTASQYLELNQLRKSHELWALNQLSIKGVKIAANQAALIPTDAYRDLDSVTMRVFENDEGQGYMNSLIEIAKPVHIGKTVSLYRTASDKSGVITRSVSGQRPTALSKTVYDYQGDPVPIFSTGYGRPWREGEAFSSEGFDAMVDDQYNSSRDIKEDMAIYMLWGDSQIVVKGYQGYGICTHPNTQKLDLGAAGANIDLTTASADAVVAYFQGPFAEALDNNYVSEIDELWVSPQMRRNFKKVYSTAGQFKEGTVEDYLLRYGRIKKIETTYELGREGQGTGDYNVDGEGNEFFCYVKNESALQPLVGQGVSTVAIPQLLPMDDDNTLIWAAMGMRVKSDQNGRSQVFYASEVS